jgi:hypothetical protein
MNSNVSEQGNKWQSFAVLALMVIGAAFVGGTLLNLLLLIPFLVLAPLGSLVLGIIIGMSVMYLICRSESGMKTVRSALGEAKSAGLAFIRWFARTWACHWRVVRNKQRPALQLAGENSAADGKAA